MQGRLPLRVETVTCTEVQIKDRVRVAYRFVYNLYPAWDRCRRMGSLTVVMIQLDPQEGSHLGDIGYRLVEQFFHPTNRRK